MGETERRRGAPRVAQPFMVRYRRNATAPWRLATLKDLSREGVRFVCEEVFESGEVLELQFGLPLFLQPTQIVGRIAWKRPVFSGRLQMTEYGLCFTSLPADVRQTLDDAMQRFVKHH